MSFKPRLFIGAVPGDQTEIVLDESTSRYLVTVLRIREGLSFFGFDPNGCEYVLNLKTPDPERAVVVIRSRTEKSQNNSNVCLTLGQSLPKASKMDLILRQGTEIGIHRFIPLITQRSISRPEISQYEHKKERWNKILIEACRQCGRANLPTLDDVRNWNEAQEFFKDFDLVLMPYEKEAMTLRTVLESRPSAFKNG